MLLILKGYNNNNNNNNKDKRGGHNKIEVLVTDEAFELLKNSYNLRIQTITNISPNIQCMKYVLPIETQTMNFIENCLGDLTTARQVIFGKYRVDLYIADFGVVVECDEFGHRDRDEDYEEERRLYLTRELELEIVRYNPNDEDFDISNVIREINCLRPHE